MYRVVEKFVSINGEGMKSGELAVFIRFQKCNLRCSYCDTAWACTETADYVDMTSEDIVSYIAQTGVRNVTLTGGEPLLQDNLSLLITDISRLGNMHVEIETNGSKSLEYLSRMIARPSFTMDYKLPSSGMEDHMKVDNFEVLTKNDTLKFVCGSIEDLDVARAMIKKHGLLTNTNVYLSPVHSSISPEEIVDYMVKHNLNGVKLQLQLHKYIWDPNKRGV
ncbi:putative 7-carboxy-7-deazaguanine synthase QueE [Fusibacter sp. JL216-2]|uniref:putative 7-carboxy-7-deazaguanine synthase QueE n=1 Tax=Fusibacter sp. JL216-2 TaxID=3071453 RepID=UPI003D334EBA